jgi:signal transduction histidine kinase/CheY-like chemotaxis protein
MDERRVLILAPSRRDGEVTGELLAGAGLTYYICRAAPELAEQIAAGAGAVVLTDAALRAPHIEHLRAALGRQQDWSDLPIVLLCRIGAHSAIMSQVIASLTNVTLLDRPSSARILLSAVQAAVRGRLRQYQLREQLAALRSAQDALRARERQLHLADRRKDEFLAMLAHELRNPLAPIRNAGELLARIPPTDVGTQATAAIVKRQVAHLSRLVDDLLDVSRITQGRIELHRESVDLTGVVAQAMESVDPLFREHEQRVFVTSSYGPLWVNGDSARLVQCVTNILTNAAKYTDRGGQIHVEVRAQDAEAVIVVADNGVGIAPELLPQIFDLFVQSDRSLDRSQGGLGIGLSVVQRLIHMHGGTVSARSDGPGRGATFEMRLPRVAAPAQEEESAPARGIATRRILIVDDNTDAADSLAMILNMDGHEAEPVYDARAALERVGSFAPEVILLDIGLPGMDGYEVARRLRAGGSRAQLVALTGYGRLEDIERAKAAGFDAHLVKPIDVQLLLRRLAH